MSTLPMQTITNHFKALNELVPLHPIRNSRDYNKAVAILNQLLDAGGANEKHALADLVATLGELIGDYEDAHQQESASPIAVLCLLMEQHELKQTDLPEIGSQGVVSEILKGKRELNVRQANALGERFGVNPAAFLVLLPTAKKTKRNSMPVKKAKPTLKKAATSHKKRKVA